LNGPACLGIRHVQIVCVIGSHNGAGRRSWGTGRRRPAARGVLLVAATCLCRWPWLCPAAPAFHPVPRGRPISLFSNNADSGAGSLRQAVIDSNAAGGSNNIIINSGDTTRPVSASFAGAPALGFTTFGSAAPRDGVVLGLGANTNVAERTSLYDGDLAGGNTNHVLSAGVRFVW